LATTRKTTKLKMFYSPVTVVTYEVGGFVFLFQEQIVVVSN